MTIPAELPTITAEKLFKSGIACIGYAVMLPNRDFKSKVMIVAGNEEELRTAVQWFKQNGRFNRLDMQRVAVLPFEAVDDPDEL
jgi:hypothetical protein